MKFFKRNFRGKVDRKNNKTLMADAIKEMHTLNINIENRNFDLLDENSKLKDKNFKLLNENNEMIKLIDLREKDIKDLEKKNKLLRSQLNELTSNVDVLTEHLNLIISKQDEVLEVVDKLNGNIYEIKPIKKCTGSKQKMQVKSNAKNSSIIKKVVGNDEEKQTN